MVKMSTLIIPEGYRPSLNIYETQQAIVFIKRVFGDMLSAALNLRRVSAPLFVTENSGLNDNLNGVERPVSFDIPDLEKNVQIVHSLAKWKRMALDQYGFEPDSGLYTDMNAIRRDEVTDNLHSVYVDQWDWEKIISREDRCVEFLKENVRRIVYAICETQLSLNAMFPKNQVAYIDRNISFVTSQELEDMYPEKTPKERENAYLEQHHTTFIMQIGGALKSGQKHDGRAPDYDDWSLNGDILFWNPVLKTAFEVSSMGIRVDAKSMKAQLALAGKSEWENLPFHKAILNDELPLTMGGGIGQSRLCMLLLGKAHIGEVQVSVWHDDDVAACKAAGFELL